MHVIKLVLTFTKNFSNNLCHNIKFWFRELYRSTPKVLVLLSSQVMKFTSFYKFVNTVLLQLPQLTARKYGYYTGGLLYKGGYYNFADL